MEPLIRTNIFNKPGSDKALVLMESLLGPNKGNYIWALCKLKDYGDSLGNEYNLDSDHDDNNKGESWLSRLLKKKEVIEEWEVLDSSLSKGHTSVGPAYQCNYCWTRWDTKLNWIHSPAFIRALHEHYGFAFDDKMFKVWKKNKNWKACPVSCQANPLIASDIEGITENFDRIIKYTDPSNRLE